MNAKVLIDPSKLEIKDNLNVGYIYLLKNSVTNMCYVGQTVDFHKRISEHRRAQDTCHYLNRAIKKYGWEKFSSEILEICSLEMLNEREIFWKEKFFGLKN